MDNSIIINSKIYEKFIEHNIPQSKYCLIIQYLLSLYFHCEFDMSITEKQKHLVNRLGIINFNKDTGIYFEIPLLVLRNQSITEEITKDFISIFLELFPANTVKLLGYDLHANKEGVRIKMNKFVKDFNNTFHSKYSTQEIYDIILAATRSYIIKQRQVNYKFTMVAHYFIHHKDKGSLLTAWCKAIITELDKSGKIEEVKEFSNNKDL